MTADEVVRSITAVFQRIVPPNIVHPSTTRDS